MARLTESWLRTDNVRLEEAKMDFSKLKKMLLVATVSALPMLSFAQDVEVITVEGGDGPILSRNQQEYNLTVEHALLALHAKNYDTSFRLLNEGARFGNKQSQFYLAMSYFNGWGTDINNKQGWLWLNVAMEARNSQWNHSFKKISEAIPEEVQTAWKADVAHHIETYGAEATEHNCKRYRPTGSSITEIICEREFDGS